MDNGRSKLTGSYSTSDQPVPKNLLISFLGNFCIGFHSERRFRL